MKTPTLQTHDELYILKWVKTTERLLGETLSHPQEAGLPRHHGRHEDEKQTQSTPEQHQSWGHPPPMQVIIHG